MMTQHILHMDEMPPNHKPVQHIVLPPPKIAPSHEVFAETMLEDTSVHQKRSPLDWAVSLVLHGVVLTALLLIPLYYTQHLDVQKLTLTFLAVPTPPMAAAPAPPAQAMQVTKVVKVVPRLIRGGILLQPRAIPTQVAVFKEDSLPPDVIPGGIPGGVLGGIPGQGIIGGTNLSAGLPVAPPATVAEGPRQPVRIGGDVKPPRLLSGPEADYPVLARQSHIAGTVVIEAIIDEHGRVIEAHAISGHPLLIPSALKAVSARLYAPTILDGEPTPIDLKVEVNFRMG
jgi:outer membrane biosynthesis protein TonB